MFGPLALIDDFWQWCSAIERRKKQHNALDSVNYDQPDMLCVLKSGAYIEIEGRGASPMFVGERRRSALHDVKHGINNITATVHDEKPIFDAETQQVRVGRQLVFDRQCWRCGNPLEYGQDCDKHTYKRKPRHV